MTPVQKAVPHVVPARKELSRNNLRRMLSIFLRVYRAKNTRVAGYVSVFGTVQSEKKAGRRDPEPHGLRILGRVGVKR